MAETQREAVPTNDAGELDTALAFLSFARSCVIKKTDGLTEEQLRRVLVDSETSLLGLVQHLTVGERYWFGYHLTGSNAGARTGAGAATGEDWDFSMVVPADRDSDQVIEAYREAIKDSDAAISAAGDPTALTARPVLSEPRTLRWVLAHVTSETARHAGHADILREQLDGTTGR